VLHTRAQKEGKSKKKRKRKTDTAYVYVYIYIFLSPSDEPGCGLCVVETPRSARVNFGEREREREGIDERSNDKEKKKGVFESQTLNI
jgi:hypothetical protein